PAPTVFYTLSLHDALPIYFPVQSLPAPGAPFGARRNGFVLKSIKVFKRKLGWIMMEPPLPPSPPSGPPLSIYFSRLKLTQPFPRSEEHTSELQSRGHLVCR